MPLIAALFLAAAATIGLHGVTTTTAEAQTDAYGYVQPHHHAKHHHKHHVVHHHAKTQAKAPVIVAPSTPVAAETHRDPIGAEIRRQDAEAHAAPVVAPEAPKAPEASAVAPATKAAQRAPSAVLGALKVTSEVALATAAVGSLSYLLYTGVPALLRRRRPVITRRSPKAS